MKVGKKKFVYGGNEPDQNTGDRKLLEMGCNIKECYLGD